MIFRPSVVVGTDFVSNLLVVLIGKSSMIVYSGTSSTSTNWKAGESGDGAAAAQAVSAYSTSSWRCSSSSTSSSAGRLFTNLPRSVPRRRGNNSSASLSSFLHSSSSMLIIIIAVPVCWGDEVVVCRSTR